MPIILDGSKIFKIMDTHGLPLDTIVEELRSKGVAFNVCEFVDAALISGNFTLGKIRAKLLECLPSQYHEGFIKEFERRYVSPNAEKRGINETV